MDFDKFRCYQNNLNKIYAIECTQTFHIFPAIIIITWCLLILILIYVIAYNLHRGIEWRQRLALPALANWHVTCNLVHFFLAHAHLCSTYGNIVSLSTASINAITFYSKMRSTKLLISFYPNTVKCEGPFRRYNFIVKLNNTS